MLYRICTEDTCQPDIEKIVVKYFPGFTIIKAEGFWLRKKERSLIIEILTEFRQDITINNLAEEIKHKNKQDSVLVEKIECHHNFI